MPITFRDEIVSYALGRRGNMEEWNTITRTNESATAVGFGAPVQRGTGDHGCLPYDDGEILGITEANQVLPHVGDEYVQYDSVAICEVGVIGVMAGDDVAAGELAAWDATYDSGAGGWVPADTANPAVPGAIFETSGSAGEVVLLRYRRPVPSA